jgi:hypothetical protein
MHSSLYEFFRDQGSLIAGVLALIAGVIAYCAGAIQARTAREGVDRQLAAATQRDRVQARCIAVGISPELLQLEVTNQRAREAINLLPTLPSRTPNQIIADLQDVKIGVPPMSDRLINQLHMLGEPAGPTLLQLISIICQYNYLIDRISDQIERNPAYYNPARHQEHLGVQLTIIGELIPLAQRETAILHDEATAGTRSD